MKLALPTSQQTALMPSPRQFEQEFKAGTIILMLAMACLWLLAMSPYCDTDKAVRTVNFVWNFFAVILLVGAACVCCRSISVGAKVLRQRCSPIIVWQSWLANALKRASALWAFCVLGTLLLTVKAPLGMFIDNIVTLSSLMCLTCGITFAAHRLVRWKAFAMLLAAGLGFSLLGLLIPFDHYPAMITSSWLLQHTSTSLRGLFIVLALSWPVLALRLNSVWHDRIPASRSKIAKNQPSPTWEIRLHALFGPLNRYSVLNQAQSRSSLWIVFVSSATISFQANILGFTASWHDSINGFHLLMLAMLIVMSTGIVLAKDINWRRRLAPGATPTLNLGGHILRITLAAHFSFYFFWLALMAGYQLIFTPMTITELVEIVWQYRILGAEFLFAITAAVIGTGVLSPRTMPQIISRQSALFFIGLFAGLITLVSLALYFHSALEQALFPVGNGYLIALLLATAILARQANKVWTLRKLLPAIRGKDSSLLARKGARHG